MGNSLRVNYLEEVYPNGNLKLVEEVFMDEFCTFSVHIYNFSPDGTMHDHYERRDGKLICHHGMEKRKWNDRDRDVIRFLLNNNMLNNLCNINDYNFDFKSLESKSNKCLVKKRK